VTESGLYPELEPYASGMLAVPGGDRIYWETCGTPSGTPALVLHGGPGSGCTPWHRRLFDPAAYRIVLFDQRNCGRSLPSASAPDTDLSRNTTDDLIDDTELLRAHVGVERWLVLGGSWGSALALAYAERFPHRVSALILFGVTTGRREEFDWLFRDGLRRFFPEEWERRQDAVPTALTGLDIVEAYHRLLSDPDPAVRRAAAVNWCMWESATPRWPPTTGLAPRFADPSFAMVFARIVTHYVRHDAWLGDGRVMRDLDVLRGIPTVLINGRFDFQAPVGTAWELHRRLPGSRLIVVDDAGHAADASVVAQAIVRATDELATR
jgi:proline iminopeptidase